MTDENNNIQFCCLFVAFMPLILLYLFIRWGEERIEEWSFGLLKKWDW